MSGIFGIIRLPGAAVPEDELAVMADTLKHRGPDGIRYGARNNAGLGHCMLYSTPESLHETLPFRDGASGLTITADARIDNREQLMKNISVRPVGGEIISDSQFILRAYMKWGDACVDHLLGDFAFAIWDERANSLFVARDHMGCKPFYYHCHDGLFVFASTAMAVARVAGVKATLNEGRVADYLVQELEGINKTCSWYNEISRMPPAQCGDYRNNRFHFRQYWTLRPADLSHLKTDEDYLEAFTEVYTEAVRVRLRCQMEPASMLSGGLDSSTIVALARDLLVAEGKPPLRTYSGISECGENCPETRSVEAVVAQENLRARCLRPSDSGAYFDAFNDAMLNMEDPFDASWTLLTLMFSDVARDGGRCVLDGLDGDLSMGVSTAYLTFIMEERDWSGAWWEASGYSQHYYRGYYSATMLYVRALRSRLMPDTLRRFRRKFGANSRYRSMLEGKLVLPEFAHRTKLAARVSEYERLVSFSGAGLQAWHAHVMQVPYLTAAIERYERIASYFGVEARHPLLDVKLMEFSASLPLRQKVRNGWTKYLLRLLASKRLPDSVAWREGSESLSWSFAERQAEQFDKSPGFPHEKMEVLLGSILDHGKLEKLNPEYKWCYYLLYQWLKQSGQSVSK